MSAGTRLLTLLGVVGCWLAIAPAGAQASVTAVVETTGGGVTGPPSAQHANETLADAVAYVQSQGGGSITFAPSLTGQTITLTSALPDIGNPLTITGPSSGTVTISGAGTYGIFDVSAGSSLTVSNLTLSHGAGTEVPISDYVGGAIFGDTNSIVTVENSVLTDNSASTGGGAIASEGTLSVTNSTISNNTSASAGGAIYAGAMTISGSTLSGNEALLGGAIYSVGSLTLSGSTLSGNAASNGSTIGAGGAIFQAPGGQLTVSSSTIDGNQAAGTTGELAGGGGIWADASQSGEPVSLLDTVVAANTANEGPDVLSYGPDPQTSVSFSLIGNDSDAGLIGSTTTDLLGTEAAPLNPLLGPLQNNGGTTETMLPLPGSPAIDAGQAPTGVTTDQRGDPRTVKLGFTEPSGGDGTDIGAVELQANEVGLPTVSGVSPLAGQPGTTVTITGTNLFSATQVIFGATSATSFTPVSATQITAVVPAGTGTVDIRVVTPAGESATAAADQFSYPTSITTATLGDQGLSLTAPTAAVCLAPTAKLSARFSSRKIKGSKLAKLTFKSVAFYIDRGIKRRKPKGYKPNATSKRTPASVKLSLKGLKAATHKLRVIAAYTEHVKRKGKTRVTTVTKAITTSFRIC